MTTEAVKEWLTKEPFVPLRVHLVGGKAMRIKVPYSAFLLPDSLLILKGKKPGRAKIKGYEVLALSNVERIEIVGERKTR